MAKPIKLVYGPDHFDASKSPNLMDFEFSSKSGGKLIYVDPDTGAELVMKGSGLKVQGDIVVKGTFDSWTVSFEGKMSTSITSMDLDAAKLSHTSTQDL